MGCCLLRAVAAGEVVAAGGRGMCVARGRTLFVRGCWTAGSLLAGGVLFGEAGAVLERLGHALE